jgi:hypothetical protein
LTLGHQGVEGLPLDLKDLLGISGSEKPIFSFRLRFIFQFWYYPVLCHLFWLFIDSRSTAKCQRFSIRLPYYAQKG